MGFVLLIDVISKLDWVSRQCNMIMLFVDDLECFETSGGKRYDLASKIE